MSEQEVEKLLMRALEALAEKEGLPIGLVSFRTGGFTDAGFILATESNEFHVSVVQTVSGK